MLRITAIVFVLSVAFALEQVPEVKAPKVPEVKVPEVKVPEVKAPTLPEAKVPEVPKVPEVKAPEAPKVEAPKVPEVKAPEAPKVEAPKVPEVKASEVPKAKAPEEKKPLNRKQCLNIVNEVQTKKKYTEESIAVVCNAEMKSGDCDFFAEALSLARAHSDFKDTTFCRNMGRAQFCSKIMDNLLESRAVSDLAFGECERTKSRKNIDCRQIQQMLGQSVATDDLDTLRACYMMEAYKGVPAQSKQAATKPHNPTKIVHKSTSLDHFGKGKGKGAKAKPDVTKPTPKAIVAEPASAETSKAIIVEPVPSKTLPKAAPTTEPASAPRGPIISVPVPAQKGLVQQNIITVPVPTAQLQKSTSRTQTVVIKLEMPALPQAAAPIVPAAAPKPVVVVAQPASKAAPVVPVKQALVSPHSTGLVEKGKKVGKKTYGGFLSSFVD